MNAAYPSRDHESERIIRHNNLRDYFAGAALTGLLAMCAGEGIVCGTCDDVAKVAYKHADAMMKARQK